MLLGSSGPSLVATPEQAAEPDADSASTEAEHDARPFDGAATRFTLRLPEDLKERVDGAAASAGVSANPWLVRAAERALGAPPSPSTPTSSTRPGRSLSGWIA